MSYLRQMAQILLAGTDGETVKVEALGLEEPIIGKLLNIDDDFILVEDSVVRDHSHYINPAHITSIKVKTAEA